MITKESDLPITRQCELLSLNRSTVYYRHQEVAEADLELMRRINEMYQNARSMVIAEFAIGCRMKGMK